jgi:hypothetical protein
MRFTIRDLLWLTVVAALSVATFLVMLVGLTPMLMAADEVANKRRVAEVKELIEGMPHWPFAPLIADKGSTERAALKAKEIENAATAIAKYDLEEIREAVRQIESEPNEIRRSEQLFIVNQFLFDVPLTVAPDSKHYKYFSAGFIGMPKSVMTSRSWPWEARVDGTLRFSTKAHGITRMGPPYPALEVFDHFRKHFGARKSE